MALLARALRVPSYGYEYDGQLVLPTRSMLFGEFFRRLNPIRDPKTWVAFLCWTATLACAVPLIGFFAFHFSFPLLAVGFVYSMVILGTHGTIWYHRYCTHKAFQFSHPFYRFIVKNMVVKLIPDELYVVSHHVHHWVSEKPGDPYNVNGGWLYCFLADANHQPISVVLSEEDYVRVVAMLSHIGMRTNSYQQYLRWGSVAHPVTTTIHFVLNWAFWWTAFSLIGGTELAMVCFASCGVWGIGVRTFNFDGHGAGKDKRQDGVDFYREDHSINQLWPGLVTGEWHNNHHLYPQSARAGFLPYQLDYAWWGIMLLNRLGGVSSYRDHKERFFTEHYDGYIERKAAIPQAASAT